MGRDHVKFRSSKALLMSVTMVIDKAYQTIYILFEILLKGLLFNVILRLFLQDTIAQEMNTTLTNQLNSKML